MVSPKIFLTTFTIFFCLFQNARGMQENDSIIDEKELIQRKQHVKEDCEAFKKIIDTALRERYPSGFVNNTLENYEKWSPLTFFEKYTNFNRNDTPKRIEKLCNQMQDIQLQFFYIREVDLGLYNLFEPEYNCPNSTKSALNLLTRLSLDQNLIIKSRILWEKIMNFIYFFENDRDLEIKKGKKKKFFNFAKSNKKWNFLTAYEEMITKFDNSYRTPEVHTNSILRKELNNPTITFFDLIRPLNYAQNVIWENLVSIISGDAPNHFTDLHFKESFKFTNEKNFTEEKIFRKSRNKNSDFNHIFYYLILNNVASM